MALKYLRSGAAGTGTGADWTNAYTTLVAAFAGSAAGDTIYVSEDHAETAAAGKTLTPPGVVNNPIYVICVDHLGSVPPVAADLRTTGSVATTGANAITFSSGFVYVYGVIFSSGSGANDVQSNVGSNNGSWIFDNCKLRSPATGNNCNFNFGSQTIPKAIFIKLINTPILFGGVGGTLVMAGCRFVWLNTANAIETGGVAPSFLFDNASIGAGGDVYLEGIDLSYINNGQTLVAAQNVPKQFTFKDCAFGNSNVIIAANPQDPGYAETFVVRSDSAANTSYRNEKYQYTGNSKVNTTFIRTSGANDGTTGLSWVLTTGSGARWDLPLEGFPIVEWNDVTGANVTATVEGLWNNANLPTNGEIWFDAEYMGATSSPLGTFKSGSKASLLATAANLTASTEAWDSQLTARANSTAYTTSDARKVASNPGRVFFCTTNGTSASSEPAGYATAVDGGTVTDGTAVFRAGVRFKQTISLTSPQPQQKGYVYVYPKAAKASATFYIDPKITLG